MWIPSAWTIAVFTLCGGAASSSQTQSSCAAFGPDFFSQAETDFEPFHNLSPHDAQRTRNLCLQQGAACFVIQIVDGRVYVSQERPGFQSRNRITMAMLMRVAARFGPLPDAEFVVDTSDGYAEVEAPLFVIAKFPRSAGGILYPDFSSFAWPESECPSEPPGSHVWHRLSKVIAETSPPWSAKEDSLFWRGAATSVYRQQVLPRIASVLGANVSFMEWVQSQEGRQEVRSGECVPLGEWCRHRFLANLPGNTMALSLKYRMLCGSVILSPPFWYIEWYYSQLVAGLHFVELDPAWRTADDALRQLRGGGAAEAMGEAAKEWATNHLSDNAFDCYWYHLIQLVHKHFPPPSRLDPSAIPLEQAVLISSRRGSSDKESGSQAAAPPKRVIDVAIVIPMRISDAVLRDRAKRTWLHERSLAVTQHYFVVSAQDPDWTAAWSSQEDVLVVDCPHGYLWLMQKMMAAYRTLLQKLDVQFFIRADIDSVLPLPLLLPLLPLAAHGEAVVQQQRTSSPPCSGMAPRVSRASVGHLLCQTECSLDRQCNFFATSATGDCATYTDCHAHEADIGAAGVQSAYVVHEYRLRHELRTMPSDRRQEGTKGTHSFILGTILYDNKVLTEDTHNPQWNNRRYREDLGLRVYPPYPEASGYAMSADVAAFLARVGEGDLSRLSWKSWAIEDTAMGTALAGLNVSLLQFPAELRERMRVIRLRRNDSLTP